MRRVLALFAVLLCFGSFALGTIFGTVRGIVHAARGDDFRFSSLVLGIVNSTPFQMRRSQ